MLTVIKIVGVVVLAFIVLGVGVFVLLRLTTPTRKLLSESQQNFAGRWTDSGGNSITVSPDGSGAYSSASSSISGGVARLVDDTLVIQLSFFKKTFHIDQPPVPDQGVWKMKLNGVFFTKPNPFALASNAPLKPEEGARLNKKFLALFDQSIAQGDPALFYSQISATWKAQTTPEQLRNALKTFYDRRVTFKNALDVFPDKATVSQPDPNTPVVQADNVFSFGDHATLTYSCKYILENGAYELMGFSVASEHAPHVSPVSHPSGQSPTLQVPVDWPNRDLYQAISDAYAKRGLKPEDIKTVLGQLRQGLGSVSPDQQRQVLQQTLKGIQQ